MKQYLLLFALLAIFSLIAPELRGGDAEAIDKAVDKHGLPNIILVMADDQGYGDAGYTGHPTLKTPAMDLMASEAVVFNRFYAAAPVCSPTRASVMTGRHPMRVNVPDHGHYLRPDEYTIAEFLKDAGYVTGHFGKWHIGSVQKESPTSPGGAGFDEWQSGLNFYDQHPYLSENGTFKQIKGQGSVIAMDSTIAFLKKHKDASPKKPMFAVTWFPAPHDPHKEVPVHNLTPYEGKHAGYYQEIQLIDQQLGRLRKTLREMDIAENTILWYCSDNGGLVKAYSGGREKKRSLYEGGLRVPALLEWPAVFKPGKIDVPANTSDIMPTIMAIVASRSGWKPRALPPMDGIGLLDVISGKQSARGQAMGFWFFYELGQSTWNDRIIKKLMIAQQAGEPTPLPERIYKNVREFPTYEKGDYKGHAAWLDWPWKLHRIQRKGPKVTIELYNLAKDPMEASNLADKAPERVQQMRAALEAWQTAVHESHAGKDYANP